MASENYLFQKITVSKNNCSKKKYCKKSSRKIGWRGRKNGGDKKTNWEGEEERIGRKRKNKLGERKKKLEERKKVSKTNCFKKLVQ